VHRRHTSGIELDGLVHGVFDKMEERFIRLERNADSLKMKAISIDDARRIIVVAAATVIIAMIPLALMDLSTLKGFAIITILGVLVGVIVTRPAYGKIIMEILSK